MRILVLRPGAIGDTLVALPALQALRRAYPDAMIEMVGNGAALPLLHAAGVVDRWIDFDDARVTRLFTPLSRVTDDHFAGIDAAVVWGSDPDGVLRRALERRGARRVVVAPSRPHADRPIHVARHLLDSLVPLGISLVGVPTRTRDPDDDVPFWFPKWTFPPEVEELAREELEAAGLLSGQFVVIHPGSGSVAKNWPAEHYAWVVDRLASEYEIATVVVGGPADADTLAVMRDGAGVRGISAAGLTIVDRPLLHVAALMGWAGGFLGNDSGLSHLAGLLGLPTVALFGPSDPRVWRPLGPVVRVLRSEPLAALPREDVLTELVDLYDGP